MVEVMLGTKLLSVGLVLVLGVVACQSAAPTGDQAVSPQPQPSRRQLAITAPCTAEACGEVPEALARPRCRGESVDACGWSEDTSVSYRGCEPTECSGAAPTAEICPDGTTFGGSNCGSEDEAPCAWTTACVPPRSTTPCPDGADACGPTPEIGVVCADGSTGSLVCVLAGDRCEHQRSCD
jgi:hypothetical protein